MGVRAQYTCSFGRSEKQTVQLRNVSCDLNSQETTRCNLNYCSDFIGTSPCLPLGQALFLL